MFMKCPLCHRENRDDACYCDGCGALLYEHSYASDVASGATTDAPAPASSVPEQKQNTSSDAYGSPCASEEPGSSQGNEPDGANAEECVGAEYPEGSTSSDASASPQAALASEPACAPAQTQSDAESSAQEHASTLAEDDARETPASNAPSDPQLTQKIDLSGLTESGYGFQDFADKAADTERVSNIAQPRFATGGETMQMPAIHTDEVSETKEYITENTAHRRAPLSAGVKRTVFIVVVLVVLALCAGAITYSMSLWGGKPIPDVVGKTPDVAAEIVKDAGFEVAFAQDYSDDANNVILRSEPAAKQRGEKGSVVTLVVACARSVPDVKGLSESDALQQLSDRGYSAVRSESVPSDEEEGTVIKQNPDANMVLPADGAITLTLAAPYVVPDVVNKSVEEACDVLKTAGYKYEISYTYTDSSEKEHVVSSEPAAGEKLHSGKVVALKAVKYRGTELVALAKQQLKVGTTIKLGGVPFKVNEVRQVTYSGGHKVKANIVAQPYATLLGESVFLKKRDVTLTLSFDANNKLQSMS